MDSTAPEKKIDPTSTDIAYVRVVGKNKLQNELLLAFLKEKTGIDGTCTQRLDSTDLFYPNDSESIQFILVDYENCHTENLWDKIDLLRSNKNGECVIALCNVDPETELEKSAISNKIKGLFYKNDPPHVICKGIFAILKGEYWYPRKTLIKYLFRPNVSMNSADQAILSDLTQREKEILSLIASEHTNKKIADTLFISFHTVKTHIHNIYKKLNVNNRYQAVLWAMNNLK